MHAQLKQSQNYHLCISMKKTKKPWTTFFGFHILSASSGTWRCTFFFFSFKVENLNSINAEAHFMSANAICRLVEFLKACQCQKGLDNGVYGKKKPCTQMHLDEKKYIMAFICLFFSVNFQWESGIDDKIYFKKKLKDLFGELCTQLGKK